jgi:CPA2 family monovalent cation:H+ antiporter-2
VTKEPGPIALTVLIIVIGKSVAAFVIVRLFGHPTQTGLLIAVSLAQIGEFSFILAGLGVTLELLPERGRDLILAGAIISILLNPVLFAALDWWERRGEAAKTADPATPSTSAPTSREPIPATLLRDHVVLVGHGRVGSFISARLKETGTSLLVVEHDGENVKRLQDAGTEAIAGNAADPQIVSALNLPGARCLLVAIPEVFEGGQVVDQARRINPELRILARAHSEEEVDHLRKHGASDVIMGEHEIAKAMLADIGLGTEPGRDGASRQPVVPDRSASERS